MRAHAMQKSESWAALGGDHARFEKVLNFEVCV
jgi:hypothetical protein